MIAERAAQRRAVERVLLGCETMAGCVLAKGMSSGPGERGEEEEPPRLPATGRRATLSEEPGVDLDLSARATAVSGVALNCKGKLGCSGSDCEGPAGPP